MNFHVTFDEQERINAFIEEQDKIWQSTKEGCECPHYGAIGGAYTYRFTPTSLGVIFVVENTVTKASLNLTDYDHW